MTQKGTQIVGQSCTVTEGSNKGKKGKYTRDDEGNIWCESDWGGTECGASRCSDAKAQVSVFEYFDSDGTLVHEADGIVDVGNTGTFHCHVVIDAVTGQSRKITTVPITSISLAELRESGSDVDRRTADAIEAHFRDKVGPY